MARNSPNFVSGGDLQKIIAQDLTLNNLQVASSPSPRDKRQREATINTQAAQPAIFEAVIVEGQKMIPTGPRQKQSAAELSSLKSLNN